jgi:hypothetical protein
MNCIKTTTFTVAMLAAISTQAGTFKIAGFTFDETNSVQKAAIVEGPLTLSDHSCSKFARFSDEYITSADQRTNAFQTFNRGRSIARLMGREGKGNLARHIDFSESETEAPIRNVNRSTIELTWGEAGLRNTAGEDFVIFESGKWEGMSVAVRKAGSDEFTSYRYEFPDAADELHNANAVAFDLSSFGLAEGDVIGAIRIRNLFNSRARNGGDKVDHASGEGNLVFAGEPKYKTSFPLLSQRGGSEFATEDLGADIVYVTALHGIEELSKKPESQAASK